MALDRSFAFCLDDVVCDWFCFFLVGAFCICMFWLRSKFAPPKTPSLLPSYPLLPPHTIAVAADAVDSVAAGAGGSGSVEGGAGGGGGASGVVVIVSADPVASAGVNAGVGACMRADVGASGSGARVDASLPPPPIVAQAPRPAAKAGASPAARRRSPGPSPLRPPRAFRAAHNPGGPPPQLSWTACLHLQSLPCRHDRYPHGRPHRPLSRHSPRR